MTKLGDRVQTGYGAGKVIGIDKRQTYSFGRPIREAWVVVELDHEPGKPKWCTPKTVVVIKPET